MRKNSNSISRKLIDRPDTRINGNITPSPLLGTINQTFIMTPNEIMKVNGGLNKLQLVSTYSD